MSLRREVLSLYRRIFRIARSWEKYTAQPADLEIERNYIENEARILFKRNKYKTEEQEIREHLKEAETRLNLAIHYQIPYPRQVNIPQNVLPPLHQRLKKGQRRVIRQSKPIYMKSYDDYEDKT